jgi:hypothetical protein
MLMRKVSIGVRAGLVAGVVLGIGARLAMRLVALASNRTAEISFEGTFGIVLIGVIIGVISGLIFMALRRFIPGNGVLKGLSFGVLVYAVLALLLRTALQEEIDPAVAAGRLPIILGAFGLVFSAYGLVLQAMVTWLSARSAKTHLSLSSGLFIALMLVVSIASTQPHASAASNPGTIAYMRGGNELRLIEPDGSHDRNLWTEPDPQFNYQINSLIWRPDGAEITFASDHEAPVSRYASDLYAIRPNGTGLRKLTNTPLNSQLSGYPKGSVVLSVGNGTLSSGPFLIYIQGALAAQAVVIPAGDAQTVTLTDVADFDKPQFAVVIDGDDRWVMTTAINVQAGSTVNGGSFLITENNKRQRYGAYAPAWRMDDSQVGFILGDCVAMYQVSANPPAGGLNEAPLLNTQTVNPCLIDRGPTPATANKILYGVYWPSDHGIYLVTEGATGPGMKLISYDTPDLLLGLQWLPDGSGFVFSKTTDYDASSNLYEYDFATNTVTPLTDFTAELAAGFSLSPDGQSIVFERTPTLGGSQIDLWIMNRDGSNLRLLVSDGQIPSWGVSAPLPVLNHHVYLPGVMR